MHGFNILRFVVGIPAETPCGAARTPFGEPVLGPTAVTLALCCRSQETLWKDDLCGVEPDEQGEGGHVYT